MPIDMKKPQRPNYTRQRFLLALLEMAGGKLNKRDMQKLLFLASHEDGFDFYDFVPFHYGCYSFSAQSDMELMVKRGWLNETDKQVSLKYPAGNCLDDAMLQRLDNFLMGPGKLRGKKLLLRVYQDYPYYATRSRIVEDVLDSADLEHVDTIRRSIEGKTTTLYTIGYEGLSFEGYVNQLIENDIRLLCDVRKNPLSRKYGFSKNTLSTVLPKLGIVYEHIPALGIPSALRKSLDTAEDYDRLFAQYRKQLPAQADSLKRIEMLLKKYKRIALTCFEKEHDMCHRHCVSDQLERERSLRVCHL